MSVSESSLPKLDVLEMARQRSVEIQEDHKGADSTKCTPDLILFLTQDLLNPTIRPWPVVACDMGD